MTAVYSEFAAYIPVVITLIFAVLAIIFADRLLIRRAKLTSHNRPQHQLIMVALTLLAIVAIILALPLDDSVRNQLLGLLGIVLTGIIAFSSTTFVANLMAGLMLRSVKSFSPGDFIEAGDHFGKVTELGLFHTEIQSEDRDLVTVPNLFLTSNPVKVVRSSGTVLNCSISLGYDIAHGKVEQFLKAAAIDAGLEDPFVQILELGDFSVTYKAAGFCRDTEHLLSARSAFKGSILNVMHSQGVEIVSPTFMNQRVLDKAKTFIPSMDGVLAQASAAAIFPETLLFDKANQAKKSKCWRKNASTSRPNSRRCKAAAMNSPTKNL
ncbi:MAG: mechanosensitive ion channel family protein [Porticoccaceae bacterium]|nr:mechanosensitive ion channel family protein [Porticoccaceae bacterium]